MKKMRNIYFLVEKNKLMIENKIIKEELKAYQEKNIVLETKLKEANISSDINSGANGNGRLLVYERGFSQACYLEGQVTDGTTGLSLSNVDVVILNTIMPQSTSTNLTGFYDSGNADSGIFDVVFSNKSLMG